MPKSSFNAGLVKIAIRPVARHVFDFVVKFMAEKCSPRSHSPSSEFHGLTEIR